MAVLPILRKDGEVGMIGVWMTPCKNGQCELSVRRDGINKIVVASQTTLTDAQAEELFWCVRAMQKSGKTLKDLLKEQEAVKIDVKKINNSGKCGRCPNCLMELNEVDYPNWCGNCGQKVKWE